MAFSFSDRQKGLLFAISAPLLYAIRTAILKSAPSAKLEMFVFSRIFFDFILLSPFFIKYSKKITLRRVPLHFGRSIFAVVAMFLSIYGVKNLYLADAILLECTLPLFIPIVYWVWYQEKISKKTFFALTTGFLGIFFLLNPKVDLFYLAGLASLGTALFTSITSIAIKTLSKTEHPIAILFYYYAFCGLFSLIPFISSWEGGLSLSMWIHLVFISLFGVLFQFANTRAYALLPPHLAGGFVYFSVLFGALFGVLFWEETLSWLQVLGGVILIFAGILVLNGNRKIEAVLDRSDISTEPLPLSE